MAGFLCPTAFKKCSFPKRNPPGYCSFIPAYRHFLSDGDSLERTVSIVPPGHQNSLHGFFFVASWLRVSPWLTRISARRGRSRVFPKFPPPRPCASAGGFGLGETARSRLRLGSARRAAPTHFFDSRFCSSRPLSDLFQNSPEIFGGPLASDIRPVQPSVVQNRTRRREHHA